MNYALERDRTHRASAASRPLPSTRKRKNVAPRGRTPNSTLNTLTSVHTSARTCHSTGVFFSSFHSRPDVAQCAEHVLIHYHTHSPFVHAVSTPTRALRIKQRTLCERPIDVNALPTLTDSLPIRTIPYSNSLFCRTVLVSILTAPNRLSCRDNNLPVLNAHRM